MNSDRQPSTTSNPTWLAPRGPAVTTWLAVDANPHRIRLVVVAQGLILGSLEAATGPRQALRTIQFIRTTVSVDANLKLVGRYYDRWPPQLHTALVQEFGPVTWINPTLLNATLIEVERWRRMFNTYRALFFAICAEEGAHRELSPIFDQLDLLCAWKNAVLQDLTARFSP